jgi:hypothetical protein
VVVLWEGEADAHGAGAYRGLRGPTDPP